MLGHELAMALRCAYLAMHRRSDLLLASSGVTADQFVVLAALSERDAVTQHELVTRTSSDPNTLRATLILLEHRRLVKRTPHPTDGRARRVSLTESGRTTFQLGWQKSDAFRSQLIKEFTESDSQAPVTQL